MALSSPCFSQSFDPVAVYEVTGTWLNEREEESKIANEALKNSKAENELLKKASTDREAKLTAASEQLSEALTLSQNSEAEALRNSIIIGVVSGLVGIVAGLLL